MNLIFQIIIITYLFLAVPFYFGILGTVKKSKKTVAELLINGYLSMFAVFCVSAVIAIQLECSLSAFSKIWLIVVIAVSIAANLLGFKQIKAFAADLLDFWGIGKDRNDKRKARLWMLLIMAVSMVISIASTRPASADATLEIVNTSLATDSMYVYDEYTGYISEYAAEGHTFSPIEMLYAAAAQLTGASTAFLLYYLVPISFLFFFYMVLWKIGKQLLKKEEQIIRFVLIAILIYWMTTYLEGQSVVTGIFLNSWNGLTLLSCCIMPAAFSTCLAWMQEAADGSGKIARKIEKICMAVTLLLAGQLTNDKGGFYAALMLFLTAAVVIVRKGYDHGITSGRFKKRV